MKLQQQQRVQRQLRCSLDNFNSQEVTDAELLALAGPSQGNVDPALRLSSVVADSARRWLAATDDTDSESTSSAEDNGNSNANRMDDETIIM